MMTHAHRTRRTRYLPSDVAERVIIRVGVSDGSVSSSIYFVVPIDVTKSKRPKLHCTDSLPERFKALVVPQGR